MSLFGASRFTAMLATVAICGSAGTLAWIIATRADLKSGTTARSLNHASQSRVVDRSSRPKNERAKLASFKRSERPQPSGWSDDGDRLRERSVVPQAFADYTNAGLQDRGADMPLPIPPVTRSSLDASQVKSPEPTAFLSQPPPETQKRLRESKVEPVVAIAPSNSPKPPAGSYYIEKLVEQGDAGEVKFRYRRQPCKPPNMPDVCFMSLENRRNIVVERR